MNRWLARLLVAVALVAVPQLLTPPVSAHPLGNFTVNSYSGLRVEPRSVAVQVVVDSAEIPTIQQFPDVDSARGVSAGQVNHYAHAECARLRPGIQVSVDRGLVPLTVASSNLNFRAGQAGLHTMRLTCELHTTDALDTTGHTVAYVDKNSLDRTGWREITAVGDGVHLSGSNAPATSASAVLTAYPKNLLTSPLDQRSARMAITTGDGVVHGASTQQAPVAAANRVDALTATFTQLVASHDLGVGFGLFALLLAVGLGAMHAFAPGHGKTLMAAYLIGKRNSLRQVAVIGLTVTLTHTAGVLVLGVVLSAVALTAPARLYAWLGVVSGLLLLGIGASLLRQARHRANDPTPRERAAELVGAGVGSSPQHPHPHPHGHGHGPGDGHEHVEHPPQPDGHELTHSHGWGGAAHTHPAPGTSARSLVAIGFAGGMVPSPSALIVLLGGIALGRAWFGILLVIAYGVGMALALTGTGFALAHARDRIERWAERRRRTGGESSRTLRITRALPVITAALVMVIGLGLTMRSLLTL